MLYKAARGGNPFEINGCLCPRRGIEVASRCVNGGCLGDVGDRHQANAQERRDKPAQFAFSRGMQRCLECIACPGKRFLTGRLRSRQSACRERRPGFMFNDQPRGGVNEGRGAVNGRPAPPALPPGRSQSIRYPSVHAKIASEIAPGCGKLVAPPRRVSAGAPRQHQRRRSRCI